MKRNVKFTLSLLIFTIILTFSSVCMATNQTVIMPKTVDGTIQNDIMLIDKATENVTQVPEQSYEFIASDVFELKESININSVVDGNVFAIGNTVTVSSEIGGDIFVLGNDVTFTETSYVHGNVFVCAENFKMSGVCYDVYAIGNRIVLDDTGVISRDLRVGADTLYINGHLKRDAYIAAQDIIFAENSFDLVSGNLNYTAPGEIKIAEGVVDGDVQFSPSSSDKTSSIMEQVAGYLFDVGATLIYSLVIILLMLWVAPNFKTKSAKLLEQRAPLSFGIGLLTPIIIAVVAAVLLFVTGGIGAPASFAAVVALVFGLTLSQTIFATACAELMCVKTNVNKKLPFVLVSLLLVLIIALLKFTPIVGGIVQFITTVLGFGILILSFIGRKKLNDITVKKAPEKSK